MKPSSTWPSRVPLLNCTVIDASLTIVPMPMRCRRAIAGVGHARDAVVADHDAPVLGIRVEARAAVDDEIERPLPLVVGQRRVRVRAAHLGPQLVRREAAAERAGDEMLDQHVERRVERHARLDRAAARRVARGGGLDELQRLRRARP